MASGDIVLTGTISTSSNEDVYPTHTQSTGKGGYRSVENIEERDAIPEQRREHSMAVFVKEENTRYILKEGLTNEDWVAEDEKSISQKDGNKIIAEEDGLYCEAIIKSDLTELDFSAFPTHDEVIAFNEITTTKYNEFTEIIDTKIAEQTQLNADTKTYCEEYQANLDAEEYVKKRQLTEFDVADILLRLEALEKIVFAEQQQEETPNE